MNITFKGGRIDCTDSPGDTADHTYPDPNMNRTEMLDWFANSSDGFGMNAEQVKYTNKIKIVYFSLFLTINVMWLHIILIL